MKLKYMFALTALLSTASLKAESSDFEPSNSEPEFSDEYYDDTIIGEEDFEFDEDTSGEKLFCNRLGRFQCQRDQDCRWDGSRCRDRGANASCEQIRDYNRCVRSGCEWDRWRGCHRSGSGGNNRLFECTARESGWEEHFSGHRGRGRNVNEAQRQALASCRQEHNRCVVRECRQIR